MAGVKPGPKSENTLLKGVSDRTAKGKGFLVDLGVDPRTGKRRYKNFKTSREANACRAAHDQAVRVDREESAAFNDRTTLAAFALDEDVNAVVVGHRKPKTASRDRTLERLYIIEYPKLGPHDVPDIKTRTIRQWVTWLAAPKPEGAGLSPDTANKLYRMLSDIMDRAVEANIIRHNPCTLKRKEKPKAEPKPKKKAPGDVWQIIHLRDEFKPRYRAYIGLGVWAQLSIGEAFGLQVSHFEPGPVDPLTGCHLLGSVDIQGVLIEDVNDHMRPKFQPVPKNHYRARRVFLPYWVTAEVVAHVRDFTDGDPASFLFTTPRDTLMRFGNFRDDEFYPAVERVNERLPGLGLDPLPDNFTPHRLRGTGATWLKHVGGYGFNERVRADIERSLRHAPGSRATEAYLFEMQGEAPKINYAMPSPSSAAAAR